MREASSTVIDRRTLIVGSAALMLSACGAPSRATSNASPVAALQAIERRANGRLGAYVLDTTTGTGFGWREKERFAHCSSFKMSLAAMILAQADKRDIDLDETLRWKPEDMLPVSPVTQANLDQGLSVRELAKATLVTSDNTAANVLLRRFGGPERLTRFWRAIGDSVSRLDRFEPELNVTPPGTELDTMTPAAMAATTAALVHGDALTPSRRLLLKSWMTEVKTGQDRIRAGFPVDWICGDKTGTGLGPSKHTYVDLAFGGPVGRAPVIVAAYFEPNIIVEPMDPTATGALAEVGRMAAMSVMKLSRL